ALAKPLQAPAEVLALFTFQRTDNPFGARTHWRGIARLEPGHRLLFTPTGVTSERYWSPEPDEQVTRLDLGAAARYCTETCVETFRGRYGGDGAWADLTGGYDSRLLSLALTNA